MSRQPCAHDITTLCSRGRIQEAFYLVYRGYREGFSISRDVIYSLLQASTNKKDIKMVRKMHSFMVIVGVHWISSLGDHIMRLLSSFGCLFDASLVFCQIMNPTTYTWNAILEAHSLSSIEEKAIFLYYEMQESGIEPDEVSFIILLKACMSVGDVKQGVLMHHEITWSVFLPNVNTVNAILDMYAKFGRLDEARNLFDSLPDRDEASWGAMFSGYAQHSHSLLIFQFYKEMEDECVKSSKASFLSFLSACSDTEGAKEGRFIHDKIARSELASDVGIGNAMVLMYVKCRCLSEAFKVFKELPFPDILSWSALITGFSLGYGEFVLRLFEELLQKGLNLTKGICLSVLKACESKESTEIVYDKLIKHRFELDIVVGSALIDVYGKLDLLQEAENVFDRLKCSHNGLTWRKIISSYNEQSRQRSPLIHLFNLIKHEGVEPGKFLLHCILNTCGQMTVLTQGRFLHYLIVRSDLSSDVLLSGSLIVMYVKCSSFEDAYNLFGRLPYRDNRSWHPLIGQYIENRFDGSVLQYVLRMQQAGTEPYNKNWIGVR